MSNISEVISKYDTILPSIVHLQPQIRVDGFTEEKIHLRQLVFSIPIQYAATARGILERSGIQLLESKQYSHGRFEFILAQEQVNISKQ